MYNSSNKNPDIIPKTQPKTIPRMAKIPTKTSKLQITNPRPEQSHQRLSNNKKYLNI